jgi:hypothetical protein
MWRFLLLVLLTAPFVLMFALVVEVRAADSESSESEEETLKDYPPCDGPEWFMNPNCLPPSTPTPTDTPTRAATDCTQARIYLARLRSRPA